MNDTGRVKLLKLEEELKTAAGARKQFIIEYIELLKRIVGNNPRKTGAKK